MFHNPGCRDRCNETNQIHKHQHQALKIHAVDVIAWNDKRNEQGVNRQSSRTTHQWSDHYRDQPFLPVGDRAR